MKQTRLDENGDELRTGEYQRKSDGKYVFSYVDPLKKRRFIYARTLPELREKEDRLLLSMGKGVDFYARENTTVSMGFDIYMANKYNLKDSTRQGYTYTFDHYIREGFGKNRIVNVKCSDIAYFYWSLLKNEGVSINTLDSVHTLLHPLFDMAVRDELIDRNPADGAMKEFKKGVKKNKGIRKALTQEETAAFLSYTMESETFSHWYPLFITMLGTGMRIGECAGLTWNDVDFRRKHINVDHAATYYKRNGKMCFDISTPKTNAGERKIPMIDKVYDALAGEYEKQKCKGFSDYKLKGYKKFIFINKSGNIYNAHCVNQAIDRICDAYNSEEIHNAAMEDRDPVLLPHFSCHILRHTFCARLCECETNIKVIQNVMGHVDIETTLNVYAEVNSRMMSDTLDKLGRLMDFRIGDKNKKRK